MKTQTEELTSNALIAITFVLAVVCIALAMQGNARSDTVLSSTHIINKLELDTAPCSDCSGAHPPFDKPYELPKDMQPAERIDTF